MALSTYRTRSERLHHPTQKRIDEQQPTQCEQEKPQLLLAIPAFLTLKGTGMIRLRLTKEAGIECHIHEWEDGQQRHGPGDLSGTVTHTTGTDPEIEAGKYDDAGQLNGECEEDGTVVERAATPSEHGDVPIEELLVSFLFSVVYPKEEDVQQADEHQANNALNYVADNHLHNLVSIIFVIKGQNVTYSDARNVRIA